MKCSALFLRDIGKHFYLDKKEVNLPSPDPHEILVKIEAVGLNPVDAKLAITGLPRWKLPFVPGIDGAGTVVKTGCEVSYISAGDRVAWHGNVATGGVLAEYALTPAHIVSKIPADIESSTAASIMCAGLTAWNALKIRMNLTPNMHILIEAGAGGVGGFAIQIAKLMGLCVITTASPVNHEYVQSLGADHVLNYNDPQLEKKILNATDGEKLDAVLDSIGPSVSPRNLNLLKHEGQYASLLGLPSAEGVDLFTVSPVIYIIALGSAHLSGNISAQKNLAQMGKDMLEAIAEGTIQSLPITQIPFSDTAVTEALHHQLEGHVKGKQVVVLE